MTSARILDDLNRLALRTFVTGEKGLLGGLLKGFTSVLGFAEGGRIRAGQLAVVGEGAGGELFIPEQPLSLAPSLQKLTPPEALPDFNAFVKATDGAKLPPFPDVASGLVQIAQLDQSVLPNPEPLRRVAEAARHASAQFSQAAPFLIGKQGPELFRPPVPGTIVPLDTAQGLKLYERMKELGLTREHGGAVSSGNVYLGGERSQELFLPDSMREFSAGDRIQVNISHRIDARGALPGVEANLERVMENFRARTIQDALVAVQELNRRKA